MNIRIEHSDWSESSAYDAIFTALGGKYVIFEGLLTKLATFAISVSKHGGEFMDEIFIYIGKKSPQVQDIWKDGEFFKMTVVALGTKIFSRTRIQGIRN